MSVAMLLVAAHKLLLAATESLIRIDWKYTIKNELKSFVIRNHICYISAVKAGELSGPSTQPSLSSTVTT